MKAYFRNALLAVLAMAAVLFIQELVNFYKTPIELSDIGFTDE